MKKNYHINFDPPKISSEQIRQHQDFDALLAMMEETAPVQEQPKARRTWLWAASAVAAALMGVIFWFNQGDSITDLRQQYAQEEVTFFEERAFVNPPFENIKPTFASYTINTKEGGSYNYGESSSLTIPNDAFQDENGVALEGDVQLFYREMHDPADFFLSGIPMTYDSAGIHYVLESAGMIEIYAEQNGKRVLMRPGKSIDIELASVINAPSLAIPPQYNIYKLNIADRKWEYQAPDNMSWLTSLPVGEENELSPKVQLEQEKEIAIAQLEKKYAPVAAPTKPRSRNSDQPSIELDFLDSFEGSAAAKAIRDQYDGAIWQLSERSTLDRNEAQKEWESVTVKDLGNEEYEITLSKADDKISFIVQPILQRADYEKAMRQYDEELLRYEQLQATSEEILASEKAALEDQYAQRIADLEEANNSFTNTSPSEKRRIVNAFKATEFGIWNCDRPLPPAPQETMVGFQDENGNSYNNQRAYLMDYNRNSVQQVFINETTVLKYDANTRQLLWIVLENNKIAVMQPEQFQDLTTDEINPITLEILDQPMKTAADVRRAIKI
ncbi:MAG: hypothetical protein AAGI23_06355 [Bacteroidota bacterium]